MIRNTGRLKVLLIKHIKCSILTLREQAKKKKKFPN